MSGRHIVAIAFALVACKGSSKGGINYEAALEKTRAFEKEMCGCKSPDCAQDVQARYETWRDSLKESMKDLPDDDKDAEAFDEKAAPIRREIRRCREQRIDKIATATQGIEQRRDKACACKDRDCADKVHAEYQTWSKQVGETFSADDLKSMSKVTMEHIAGVDMELRECLKRLRGDGATLAVTGLDPASGDIQGGTYVLIRGSGFTSAGPRNAKVYFGDRQGQVVRFQSDTELIVQAPGGKTDETVEVRVMFEPGGEIVLPTKFRFVDKSAAP